MIGYITRTVHFSSAHRLNSQFKTPLENRELYGKCNHENFHGHNYKALVTLRGNIDEETGMIMNLTELKEILGKVISKLDHANLDLDIEYFKKTPRYLLQFNFKYS